MGRSTIQTMARPRRPRPRLRKPSLVRRQLRSRRRPVRLRRTRTSNNVASSPAPRPPRSVRRSHHPSSQSQLRRPSPRVAKSTFRLASRLVRLAPSVWHRHRHHKLSPVRQRPQRRRQPARPSRTRMSNTVAPTLASCPPRSAGRLPHRSSPPLPHRPSSRAAKPMFRLASRLARLVPRAGRLCKELLED